MEIDDDAYGNIPGLEYAGTAAVIRLRRPRQHNRLDPADIPVIRSHLDAILEHQEIRVVVFTGLGDKTFSSGYTIQAIVGKLDRRFEDLLDTVENYPLPTICALNGSVYGGATDLALCCDFRIGVTGSRMFMPAARFGLHYYPGGLRRYVTQLGLAQAKRLFLTAQTIDAEEMKRIGFLTELVAPADLWRKVDEYRQGIEACEPLTEISLKRQLNALAGDFAEEALSRDEYERSLRSETLKQRLATREKRAQPKRS